MQTIDIKSLTKKQLQDEMAKLGEKSFRANQIYDWMHKQLVRDFDSMTNVSKDLRKQLQEHFHFVSLKIVRVSFARVTAV